MCCRQQREKVKEELLNKKRRIICVKLRFSLFCQSQCFGLTHWCPSNLMEAEARRGPLYAINLPQLTIISSIVHSQISGNIVFLIIIIHTWVFKATLKLHKRNQSEKKKEADTVIPRFCAWEHSGEKQLVFGASAYKTSDELQHVSHYNRSSFI